MVFGKVKKIGITGGIASGKSAVSEFLKEKGYSLICADDVSRDIMRPNEKAYEEVKKEFGEGYFENGELNRKMLAKKVFGDKAALEKLNSITHPVIREKISAFLNSKTEKPLIFVDAALLIEAGMYDMVDEIWLVCADMNERIKRIALRDGLSEADAKSRISNQMSDEEKCRFADMIIFNNGTKQSLYNMLNAVLKEYEE